MKTCETCSQATGCTTSVVHSEICRNNGFQYWTPSKFYLRLEAAEAIVGITRLSCYECKYKKECEEMYGGARCTDLMQKYQAAYDAVLAGVSQSMEIADAIKILEGFTCENSPFKLIRYDDIEKVIGLLRNISEKGA